MEHSLKRFACCCVSSVFLFTLAANIWAVPLNGTAHLSARWAVTAHETANIGEAINAVAEKKPKAATVFGLPRTVRFREEDERGLLVSAWVNGIGPYTFAIDTGAGATILSSRVADQAHLSATGKRPVMIGGLSGAGTVGSYEAIVRSLAVGDEENILPSKETVLITERLAPGIDGVLDPVEAYSPLGFQIDMVRGEMTAFDPRATSLRYESSLAQEGTVVSWLMESGSRRPFVMLEGGRRALLDTGSGFGLAVTEDAARSLGIIAGRGRQRGDMRDLAGGSIPAHRISPTTIRLGALVLRGIPTDLLLNARVGSPILLGRDALRPFRLTFDPVNRLIRIVPG
jgi:hypothetical protein